MEMLIIGFYLGIALMVFLITGFLIMLGGKNEDLYKPFVYALFWPVLLVYKFL